MKKRFLIMMLALMPLIFFSNGMGQDSRADQKQLEKREAKAQLEKEYNQTRDMLHNRDFVLEADHLMDKWGNRAWVSSSINFVMVDSTEAVIQIGSNYRLGPNGVGGVTAKGKITKWSVKENPKNASFFVQMNVMTGIGIYDVSFSISAGGISTASVTGLRPGRLTFEGDVVPLEYSGVFEGQSI
ncbi:DUF4251 domain-containing protein [Saccharicrinis sp. FJH54]|uniref:DUF4251 domain-containing protein n=1 Tax=Saccharicrinis sp. FJH54 TaxID=3344665 RepID=UPI0035D52466